MFSRDAGDFDIAAVSKVVEDAYGLSKRICCCDRWYRSQRRHHAGGAVVYLRARKCESPTNLDTSITESGLARPAATGDSAYVSRNLPG
jgi:hypothetical protein